VGEVLRISPGWVVRCGSGDPVVFGWTVDYLSEDLVLCLWGVGVRFFREGSLWSVGSTLAVW
jgi:hypothetical protein